MTDIRHIYDVTDDLIDVIKDTEEYKRYKETLREVKMWPELKEKIDDFRAENFIIQTVVEDNHLVEAVENFEKKYEGFRSDKRVNDFLKSELAFNRLMQEIYDQIMDGIEYE